MNNTTLEITENEYCIKLEKSDFNLFIIRKLIKRIQAEQLFHDIHHGDEQGDIISRNSSMDRAGNFDRLADK